MIRVIPSMSIQGGKVVKTIQGDVDQLKIYEKDPIDLAMAFEDHGFKRMHFVDIEGAKKRKVVNYNLLDMITKYTKLEIDYSGGITSDDDARAVFEHGAKFMTVASVAVHDKEKFYSWMISFGPNKMILAADSLDNIVRTGGWKKNTGIDLDEHILHYQERGIQFIKATEIARDGTMLGPNFELYKHLVDKYPDLKILACGGIRSVEDIEELEKIGVYGVIFSKSFYEGMVELKDLQKFNV